MRRGNRKGSKILFGEFVWWTGIPKTIFKSPAPDDIPKWTLWLCRVHQSWRITKKSSYKIGWENILRHTGFTEPMAEAWWIFSIAQASPWMGRCPNASLGSISSIQKSMLLIVSRKTNRIKNLDIIEKSPDHYRFVMSLIGIGMTFAVLELIIKVTAVRRTLCYFGFITLGIYPAHLLWLKLGIGSGFSMVLSSTLISLLL